MTEAAAGRFSALRHRDFALFWIAAVVSRIGTQMRDVALAWHIYVLTESPLALGLLGAARVVPILLLSFGGGMAADVFDRRRLMMWTQSVMAVTAACMALLTVYDAVTPLSLYLLIGVASLATAFDNPARQSLTVNLLPKEDLANGLSLSIMGWQVATVAGPAIAGLLLTVLPIETLYAIDAVSFAAVLGALWVVRPISAGADPHGDELPGSRDVATQAKSWGGWRAAREALSFLWRRPVLLWLMLIDFFATFFAGAMLLMPIFADSIFDAGETGLGLLMAAPAVGSMAASGYLAYRRPPTAYGPIVIGAVLIYGAAITCFGLVTSFALGLALLALSGAADAVSTVLRQTVRQLATPDALRGRMTGINMVFFIGGPQLGELEAGVVAELLDPRSSVVIGGALCVVATVLIALFVPSLRRLTSDLRSVEPRS